MDIRRNSGWRIVGAVLAVAILAGCGFLGLDPTPDYRYRLTVEVDTPQGLRSGSSVIEVETDVASATTIPSPGSVSHRVRGEAVAVDLPDGRTLFALLRSGTDADWASRVMSMLAPDPPDDVEDRFQARFDNLLALEGKLTLPRMWPPVGHLEERSAYPMLVTFGDIAVPTSVTEVDPDDLAATFGEDYALRRITVELTDAPVTTGIEKRLGWLPNYFDKMLDGRRLHSFDEDAPFANELSQGDFSRGILNGL
ncbi:hypothetical protein E3U23_05375 [Erythrobacter litoralis]|uniref:hypothetical protein n=1 Tax=Erythrobacter litoralis TaxID=39960 RepID=UPI002434DC8B|nr:hypothetical protein [Erythrobacter litoralis]MDG6078622.1 hypothetical protein [Erythrobacter litoralis]